MNRIFRARTISNSISLFILVVVLVLSFVPVILMSVMSVRDTFSIQYDFWALPRLPRWSNYGNALMFLTMPIMRSLYIAAVSIAGILSFSCLAAYAFARLRFYGKELIFYVFLFVLMVPSVLTLTPNFVLAVELGLRNTLEGLIIFYIGANQAFSIFLLRTFFRSQPEEIFESARLDGAGELRLIWHIAVPLAQPILITLCIMNFFTIYNDLIWPLLMLISRELYTVTIILQSNIGNVGPAMAGYVVASLPVLFLFIYGMEYYVEGLTSGALSQ